MCSVAVGSRRLPYSGGSAAAAGGDAAGGGGRAGPAESACWGSNGAATSNRSGEPHTRQIDRNWYSLA